MSTLADRIKTERKHKGLTQTALGKFAGVGKSSVSQWESGLTKNMDGTNMVMIAKALDVNPDWLATGKGEKHINKLRETKPDYNTCAAPDIYLRVPLISLIQAGHWTEIIDTSSEEIEEWIPTTAKLNHNAYALRIVGDSMINPFGAPSLPPGYIVIIDPDRTPKNGDIVIAMLDNNNEAVIKKLVIEGNHRYLKPLNPQYPIITINGNCTICGVAVKAEFEL